MKKSKLFALCLSLICGSFFSMPLMAQNAKTQTITGGSETEYYSNGANYRLQLEQTGNIFTVNVLDLAGNEIADAKNLTGVMGVAYSDGTADQFDLTTMGKNKAGITVPAGKTVTDVRMMVEVDGDRNVTGFNLATGHTHSGSKTHANQ